MLSNLRRYLNPQSSSLSFWWLKCATWDDEIPRIQFTDTTWIPDYFINLQAKATYKVNVDAEGLPLLDYQDGALPRYNACAMAQFGLGSLSLWGATKDDALLKRAVSACHWFMTQASLGPEDTKLFLYDFGAAIVPDLDVPYSSAIAQGQAASLLYRVAHITEDKTMHTFASDVVRSLLIPVERGGLKRNGPNGTVIFEEFPARKLHAVLDGHLYAIAALIDAHYFAPNLIDKKTLDESQNNIETLLGLYDLGYWSRTDLYSSAIMPASPFYHKLHISQLAGLFSLTSRREYETYFNLFLSYQNNPYFRARALMEKIIKKIFVY